MTDTLGHETAELTGDSAIIMEHVAHRKHGKGYLTLDDVQRLIASRSHERLFEALRPLVDAGILTPTKNARRSGSTLQPLFEKYRIQMSAPAPHDLTELNPLLVSTRYLERSPKATDAWWDELCALSRWLTQPRQGTATLRERCWEVFGDEKASERAGLASCIRKATGYDLRDLLDVREDEPEDLPLYVREGTARPRHIVVSENRDPYLSIRRGLAKGATTLLEEPIDAVVWGCGDRIRQGRGAALARALETMHADAGARVLYWGDIDREGLTILVELAGERLVEPFDAAYERMLKEDRHEPRGSPDGRDLTVPDLSGGFESGKLADRLTEIASLSKLLPQEVLCSASIEGAMR